MSSSRLLTSASAVLSISGMIKPTLPLALVVALLCTVSQPARAADEMVDNPIYKSWAKLKPGSSVTMGMNTKMPAMEIKSEIVTKLVSVDKDKAVVEMSTKVDIPGVPTPAPLKQDIPAKIKKADATPGKPGEDFKGSVKEKGDETIEVSGKKYKCKVYEYEGTVQGNKTSGKTWSSDEIPNLTAKVESNISASGQEMKSTIAVTKIDAKK